MPKGPPPMFYEVNGFDPAVKQIDQGMTAVGHLVGLMDQRKRAEEDYIKSLSKWQTSMQKKLKSLKEYECCREVWQELVDEASCTIAVHKAIAVDISENCVQETKQFKSETWKKGMFGPSTQQSTFQKQYKQAQSSWATLDSRAKKAKADYDKAAATAQASANQAQMNQDPKAQKAVDGAQQKIQQRDAKKQEYQTTVNEMNQMQQEYIDMMNSCFKDTIRFEEKRLEYMRQMMIKFREATKVKLSSQLVYERKNVQTGEMESINVKQKIDQIDAAIDNQTVEKAIAEFNRTKGPENAQSMNWPAFVEYDPDATAQQQKFNKQPSGDVATNEMQGTIKKIPDEGQTNGGYTEPPPVEKPNYNDDWGEPEAPVPPQAAVTLENGGDSEVYLSVLYAYEAQDDDELTLEEGERIIKLGEPDSEGWCFGRKEDGTEGQFPIDYVDQGDVEA